MNDYMIPQNFKAFQEILLSDDVITFQTFSDNADNKDISLTCQLHGRFDDVQDNLHELNNRGAGIYFTANKTDGKGRKRENITAVRSLFVDFDTPDSGRVARLTALDLPPTLIIESSKDKHHAYWVADGIALDDFTACQKQLISFFTAQEDAPDKAIHDLARVMRLPGFIHQKTKNGVTTDAFTSRVVYVGERYDKADLMAWLATMDVIVEQNTPLFRVSQKTGYTHTGSASDYVRQQANGRWQYVLARLGYDVGDGRHKPCPHCGGRDRFRFDNHNIKAGDGGWICSQGTGETIGGDGLSFLMDHVGMQPKDALNAVADALAITLPSEPTVSVDFAKLGNKKASSAVTDNADVDYTPEESVKLRPNYNTAAYPEQLKTLPIDPELDAMLTDYIDSYARRAHIEITTAAKIALLATLGSRRFLSDQGNTTNLYMMVLAETGVGKDYAKKAILNLLSECHFIELIAGGGSTSQGAIFSSLEESPAQIQIMDEIGKYLQAVKRQFSGQMAEGIKTLTEAYSSATSVLISKNYSTKGQKGNPKSTTIIQQPAITILGLATPGQVYENLSTVEIEDGFLNRFIIVNISEDGRGQKKKVMPSPADEQLIDWCKAIRTGIKGGNLRPYMQDRFDQRADFQTVTMDDVATEMFEAWEDNLEAKERNGELKMADMTRRWVENAMRLATLFAVVNGSKTGEYNITPEMASWAILYTGYYGEYAIKCIDTKVADSHFHRLTLEMVELVKRSPPDKGMTERDLATYSRLYASSPPVMREQVAKAKISEGVLLKVQFKTIANRGRKRIAFILPEWFVNDKMEVIA
ncbi:DUF3987 domain-containing protein [Moraxella catarrhalis]|uniref:DUF3987 domain-containing protein n=1 Tax=Moraxella catarrhalis TaxID=480 RepID=UPI00128D2AA9|nr:DUF3987 domain-containing protein [Moraxella catarrhalis]MPX14688.1 hypothetical protein [Moraxella catarrhalis]